MLSPDARAKLNPDDDALFYRQPRLVRHVDDGFIHRLQALYRERLRPGTRVLDLMSSWVSHLPGEMTFAHVEGHGMNAEELARNGRLDHHFVQNLNENPRLPLEDRSFDAVLCTVSVQYLQRPEAVFAEICRVLRPGGPALVSFSNRMFFEKAIQAWREASEAGRVELVKGYFASVRTSEGGGFTEPDVVAHVPPQRDHLAAFFGGASQDPFYAVVAERVGEGEKG